jgi:GT2 family glycosyltransferase
LRPDDSATELVPVPSRRKRAKKATPRAVLLQKAQLNEATWLTDDILLLVAATPGRTKGRAKVTVDEGRIEAKVRILSLPWTDRSGEDRSMMLAVVLFRPRSRASERCPGLTVETRTMTLAVGEAELEASSTDVRTLLRSEIASLDAESRAPIGQFLVDACGSVLLGQDGRELSEALYTIREVLREHLSRCVVSKEESVGVQVDSISAIDARSYWIKGWVRTENSPISRLTVISPEGSSADIAQRMFRYPRPDVESFYGDVGFEHGDATGFISVVELPAPSRMGSGWIAQLRNEAGRATEVALPEVQSDEKRLRETVLGDLLYETPFKDELMSNHVHPALQRLQARQGASVKVSEVVDHGATPAFPEVSLIVPLYGRIDLVEHQLAHFAHDSFLADCELIYVLDSPELGDALEDLARQLYPLYGVSSRVVHLNRNAGFAGANNAGAGVARGRLLLLLNSDVFPDRPGWLERMVEFYDRTPKIGALGPKLLYEDDSLQHAGLYFYRGSEEKVWENLHYFKGFHRRFPPANIPQRVPAVTAAALMIDSGTYERLEGLSGNYVQGDYEDSDLCLRLLQNGYQNWYLPEAELYHLEGQSYPVELRKLTTRYNMWLQSHFWGRQLEALAASGEPPAEPSSTLGSR